jgi:DnaJ-class molecular chaperone
MASDQDDIPTRPDLRMVTCPKCRGTGHILVTLADTGTIHRSVASKCPLCRGQKSVDRYTAQQYKGLLPKS